MQTRGFTIIEVIVIITIMGILLTLGAFGWSSAQMSARDTERLGDIEAIQAHLESFYTNGANGSNTTTTNLITNPSLTTNNTNWTLDSGFSGGRTLVDGDWVFRVTRLTTSSAWVYFGRTTAVAVTSGTQYTASATVTSSFPGLFSIRVRQGTGTTDIFFTSYNLVANQPRRISTTGTVNTADVNISIISFSAPIGGVVTIDDLMLTAGSQIYDYADGDTGGWSWSGTAHASTSTGPIVAVGKPGTYPSLLMISNNLLTVYLPNLDIKSAIAPGQTDPYESVLAATNNVQTAEGVLPQPTAGQYVYQPIDSNGNLCTTGECRKYNLYYRLEKDDTVYKVTSKNQ